MLRIVIVGDISSSTRAVPTLERHPSFERADIVVANLEGALLETNDNCRIGPGDAVFNSIEVLELLRHYRVGAVCLANNHIFDIDGSLPPTMRFLAEASIVGFGAGPTLSDARAPARLSRGDSQVKLLGFGWQTIGCRPASRWNAGVNPLIPQEALRTVRNIRIAEPETVLGCLLHWNFELEQFPQPAHRMLAQHLVDAGADFIVGMHSHVFEGAEIYSGKPIVFGLGNWFVPHRTVRGLKIEYPDVAADQVALELAFEGRTLRDATLHWHRFHPESNQVTSESSEPFAGPRNAALTPYASWDAASYERWFLRNRKRTLLLPVYRDHRHAWRNAVRDAWVGARQEAIRVLVETGFKRELRGRGT